MQQESGGIYPSPIFTSASDTVTTTLYSTYPYYGQSTTTSIFGRTPVMTIKITTNQRTHTYTANAGTTGQYNIQKR